jgi:bifunctional non-homologous end joining protein LigD
MVDRLERHRETRDFLLVPETRGQGRPQSAKKKSKRARQGVPAFVAPMLATPVTDPPRGGDWLYEVKHDGYRMLARLSNGEARLFTRAGDDWTDRLMRVANALAALGLDDTWLDGEIVGRDADIVYYVFDAPFLKGRDLRHHSLRERKKRLEESLQGTTNIRYRPHLEGDAKTVMDEACRLGLEGLIGKEARSTYVGGRSRSWIMLECRRMQSTPLKITHPERVIWPKLGVRKIDLVHYVEEVGEAMLPHLARRPLSLVRCPDGAEGKCFYQRHPAAGLKLAPVKGSGYVYLETVDQIAAAVQYGAIEFHTWGATVPDVKHPDRFTLDLDPDPALPWARLREATHIVRALLQELKLKSFLKTTGGKGLHVAVPIEPDLGWDEVKEFTRRIALFLQKAEPRLFLADMSKAKRAGKVFVDYLRNAETASAVAAFSPRARPDGGVSTPLAWDELGRADPRGRHTVKNVPGRLKRMRADPWRDYFSERQKITPAMQRALR